LVRKKNVARSQKTEENYGRLAAARALTALLNVKKHDSTRAKFLSTGDRSGWRRTLSDVHATLK